LQTSVDQAGTATARYAGTLVVTPFAEGEPGLATGLSWARIYLGAHLIVTWELLQTSSNLLHIGFEPEPDKKCHGEWNENYDFRLRLLNKPVARKRFRAPAAHQYPKPSRRAQTV
jgi:hypothetical protein